MRPETKTTTVLIPWDGKNREWLDEALLSLPEGMRFVVAENSSKHEMTLALNEALEHDVDSEWVFVMGADDTATPEMFDRLFDAVGAADGAYPSMQAFGDRDFLHTAQIWSPHLMQDRNICGVFLIKTERLKRVGGWRLAIIEDWDLVARLVDDGVRMVPVPDAIYNYRQYDSSQSMRITGTAIKERVYEDLNLNSVRQGRDRYEIRAVYYGQASPAQNYVRGELPALELPGVVRDRINLEHNHGAPIAVWLYPGAGSCTYLEWCRNLGLTIVADVDDDYQTPDLLKSLRRAAQKDPGLKALYESWKVEQPGHLRFIEACDVVTCATEYLVDVYSKIHDNVIHVPNTVRIEDWQPSDDEGRDPGVVRIGWAAGRQHAPDAELVQDAMRACSKMPNVEVAVMGVDPGWDFQYERVPRGNLEAYRRFCRSLDVGVAPLKRTTMNRGKSDLKWLDYTVSGAAFVGTDYEPYTTVMHEHTGLLARDRTDFADMVTSLAQDPESRSRLVENARRVILRDRTPEAAAAPLRRLADHQRSLVGAS